MVPSTAVARCVWSCLSEVPPAPGQEVGLKSEDGGEVRREETLEGSQQALRKGVLKQWMQDSHHVTPQMSRQQKQRVRR
jgi:hypothetical protein